MADSVTPSSTPPDSSDPLSQPASYDLSKESIERPKSCIDAAVPRAWDPPEFPAGGEQDANLLDPAHAATKPASEGGGSRSTVHDHGDGDFYNDTRDETDRYSSTPTGPKYVRSPSESRRSTAELVAQAGTFTQVNETAAESTAPNVASQKRPEAPPQRFEIAIRAAFIESASEEKKQFLPIDAFTRIVTRDRVRQELSRLVPYDIPQDKVEWYTDQVWDAAPPPGSKSRRSTTRRKIFAILALIERVRDIVQFIEAGLHDNDLPFIISNGPTPGTRQLNRKGSRDSNLHPIIIMSHWPTFVLEGFDQYQWKLLAPYFTLSTRDNPAVKHYYLDKGIILPFIEDHEIATGGYGEVWKVRIHPAHHNYSHDTASHEDNPPYAVKRLRHNDNAAFKAEVTNLKRLGSKDHVHLIKLLVTFKWRDQYYLLFPFADGNLLDFWKRYPKVTDPPRDRELALWFCGQILGLAEGLKMIHTAEFKQGEHLDIHPDEQEKIHGRHGDLKPENILWFPPVGAYHSNNTGSRSIGGVLKISDFGLTKFHRTHSRLSGPKNGKATAVSLTYRAPEYDIDRWIDQSYDIWTFGCVLLEFVAWYVLGWDEVERFSKSRTTDDYREIKEDCFFNNVIIQEPGGSQRETGAQAKKSVYDEFQRLYEHERCSDFILDLLKFIETKLLRMGPNKRASSLDIVEKLTELQKRCEGDARYCTEQVHGSPERARTDLSLLAASAIPYSEEQMKRIQRNPLPEVHQRSGSPSPPPEGDPSPFQTSLDATPSVTSHEKVLNFIEGGGRSNGDGDSSRRPTTPAPIAIPSVMVTPSTFGPSHIILQSPPNITSLVQYGERSPERQGGGAGGGTAGQRGELAPVGSIVATAPLSQPASHTAEPRPNPEMVAEPEQDTDAIQPASNSNSNTIRGSSAGGSFRKGIYGTMNGDAATEDTDRDRRGAEEEETGWVGIIEGFCCARSLFTMFRTSGWQRVPDRDSQGDTDGE